MSTDELQLADANARFYKALTEGDLAAMEALWLHVDWADCVHPGRSVLHGWTAVRESWEGIFAGPARLQVSITDVQLRVAGDIAWVTCLERIATFQAGNLNTGFAQATNIFCRRDGEWRLVVHHASLVSVPAYDEPLPAGTGSVN